MQSINKDPITIFTDGSCHTQKRVGAWAAILFIDDQKIILSGKIIDTNHNRMELTAVIEALRYVKDNFVNYESIKIISDSQYLVGLPDRKDKLSAINFTTKKGTDIKNADLVKEVLGFAEIFKLNFVKIKAHQKQTDTNNFNIEVDKLSRKIVREG